MGPAPWSQGLIYKRWWVECSLLIARESKEYEMTSRGMVQVCGDTYRIDDRGSFHEVVRLRDDRCVGTFRHGATLELMHSAIPREILGEVARLALRSARLAWLPPREPVRTNVSGSLDALLAIWRRGSAWFVVRLPRTGPPRLERAFR